MAALLPSAALAAPPDKLPPSVIVDFFENEAVTETCGFPVFVDEVFYEQVTVFYNQDGEETRATVHWHGTVKPYDSVDKDNLLGWDNWSVKIFLDWEDGTATWIGNMWNTHIKGEGVVLNGSGKIAFSLDDGTIVEAHGPHTVEFTGFEPLCEAVNG